MKEKVDAGADFIITQLFYDVDHFSSWLKKARSIGRTYSKSYWYWELIDGFQGILVPVIPGIMPLQSYAAFLRVTKLCETKVPPKLQLQLDQIRVSYMYSF